MLLSAAVPPSTAAPTDRWTYNSGFDHRPTSEVNHCLSYDDGGVSDYFETGLNDEKVDSSEKEFDEDTYIRGILDNPIYANLMSDDGTVSTTVDTALSEYELSILNKYLREELSEAAPHMDAEMATTLCPLREPMESTSTHDTGIDGYRHSCESSSSLSSLNRNADTSDSLPDICNSSRPSFSDTSTLNLINHNHNAINNDINHNNHSDRVINSNIRSNNSRSFGRNLSLWMGVTSCVWGLLFYFVKSYYFD